MWQRITSICVLTIALTACSTDNDSPNLEPNLINGEAPLCEMLQQKVIQPTYDYVDPETMKRKNIADQAHQMKEYQHYSCPEILDSAPLPVAEPNQANTSSAG
jgi:hypothetical protein